MNIEIRKLTSDLAEDYVRFFDVTPHNFKRKCYCVSLASDGRLFPTIKERRDHALQYVKTGSLQGYLAYHGDEIVGWCNANSDYQIRLKHMRSKRLIEEYSAGIKVKSIFCFVIAPDMQRKGIATKLLEYVCKDASDNGFDFVEAYVNEKFTETDHEFRGPLTMYEKCGFYKYGEREGKIVMRKALKCPEQYFI